MTIDPSVLDNYRRRAKGHSVEPEHSIMLNLLDALEESRAKLTDAYVMLDATRTALAEARVELHWKKSPAHSGSGDTGEDKNEKAISHHGSADALRG